jgi:predicted enzyme related to lactoylglutathione lyase
MRRKAKRAFNKAVTSIEAALADHGLVLNPGPPSAELVVWTDDTDAAFAALIEKGAKSLIAPHDFLQLHRVAWVADPEGNPIHISGPLRGEMAF